MAVVNAAARRGLVVCAIAVMQVVTVERLAAVRRALTEISWKVQDVVVQFEEVQIPAEFIGRNYEQDAEYRLAFQAWINQLWETKDAELEQLHRQFPPSR